MFQEIILSKKFINFKLFLNWRKILSLSFYFLLQKFTHVKKWSILIKVRLKIIFKIFACNQYYLNN